MTESVDTHVGSCPVAHGFDPFTPGSDPYAMYALLRESGPVHYLPALDHWIVTDRDEVAQVLADTELFTSRYKKQPIFSLGEAAVEAFREGVPTAPLFETDPPQYGRFRRVFARPLTPRAVEQLIPSIREDVEELIDAFPAAGRVDAVSALTFPLPALTLFRFLGFPREDVSRIKQWCDYKVEVIWGRPTLDAQMRAVEGLSSFWEYSRRFVEQRKREPGDDLTSVLLAQRETDPNALTDEEVVTAVYGLAFAGHETTTNLLGNALRQLLARPDLWRDLPDDRTLLESVIEETLRHDTSVIGQTRYATAATEIGGVPVPEGARLIVAYGAANRDPEWFSDPDRFDPSRENARQHVSFGRGAHSCLGQHLARAEARIVLGALARRFPDLRLAEDQEIEFIPNVGMRGPRELWVEWTP